MDIGNIIFTYDNSLLSRLIRFFDRGRFSHCTIVCASDNQILEAQYFTKSEIVPFCFENYEVIDLKLSDSQKERIQELAPDLIGRNYDYIQVLSYLVRDIFKHFKIINNPKQYICSEIVEILLQEVNAIPKDKRIRDLSPNELYKYLTSIKNKEVIE